MPNLRRFASTTLFVLALSAAGDAFAARSGGSFGSRGGFRSGGGFSSRSSGRSSGRWGGGGTNVIVAPGFGWGWGFSPFGYGGGGCGPVGTLAFLAIVGVMAVAMMRAARRARSEGYGYGGDDDVDLDQGFVYKLQLAFGRSARGIQDRLARFAAEGDTSSEAGLARLLQQTSLELLRERDSIRYAGLEAAGPMSLPRAETAMNGFTLAERSRFQVERVRGADGKVHKSDAAAEEGKEALEYVVVTLVVATRTPLKNKTAPAEHDDVKNLLAEMGGLSPDALLGLEVVWTPADANDSLTSSDVMTTYPDLRSL